MQHGKRPQQLAGVKLLTPPEAAEILNVQPRTLERWRYERTGPPYVRVGKVCRYRPDDLLAWLDSNTVTAGAS